MANLFSIAKLTFKLIFRRGGGLAVLVILALAAGSAFAVCQSDGKLVNELMIRSRYALFFSITLLSLIMLWLGCLSMRSDFDAKRLHTLTSYPLPRRCIFLGKWLGLFAFAACGLATCLLTTALAVWLYAANHRSLDDPQANASRLWRMETERTQDLAWVKAAATREAEGRLRQMKEAGPLPPATRENDLIRQYEQEYYRQWQTMSANGTRTFRFSLGQIPRHRESFRLFFRFYANDREKPVALQWGISAPHHPHLFTRRVESTAFANNTLEVPLNVIPPDGNFYVVVQGIDNPELVLPHNGVRVFYDAGSLSANLFLRFIPLLLAHLAVVIAVGLTIATAFTMSVASFTSMVLYFMALGSPFFERFLTEARTDVELSVAERFLSVVVMPLGLFFATGLEQPSAVFALSAGTTIDLGNLGMGVTRSVGGLLFYPVQLFSSSAAAALRGSGLDLVLGFGLYFLLVAGLGIRLLTRKELDRVH